MMKPLRTTVALLGCAVSLAAPAAGHATGKAVDCNTTFRDTTVSGGIVVGPGETCVLDNVTVWGGLTVNGTVSASQTAIHGGFVIAGGTAAGALCGDSVDGGLYVTSVDDPTASFVFGDPATGCAGPTVTGGVDFSANPHVGLLQLEGATVSGQLKDSANGDATSRLSGDAVTGSARCLDDTSAPVNDASAGANAYGGSNTGCPIG